jgi:hypothetical protein
LDAVVLLIQYYCQGDFEEVYGAEDIDNNEPQAGKFDAILTCFFIDTVGLMPLLLVERHAYAFISGEKRD